MALAHHIVTTKTARIFTHGTHSGRTKIIWIVAHGYGFLAEFFIKKFEELSPEEHFVIVPEALNRFYLKDMSGRVGASWMTTEDREKEIEDYIHYLDTVYEALVAPSNARIVALGFSQGASTMARWALKTPYKVDRLVVWGGTIPDDCLINVNQLNFMRPCLLVGDEDEFISKERKEEVLQRLDNLGLTFSHIFYKGGHSILTEPLMQLCGELTKA
jgi:predicted esterase